MKMYFTNSSKKSITVDITFTQAMDFTTFNMNNFQTYLVINPPQSIAVKITPDMFSYIYNPTGSSSYQITITPLGYIYLDNATFTVTTIVQPSTGLYAADGTQLNPSVYNVSSSLVWLLIKSPVLRGADSDYIKSLSRLSDSLNQFFALPYLQ